MPSDYHLDDKRSGDISRLHHTQFYVPDCRILAESGLTVVQISDAFITETTESTTRCQMPTSAAADFADCPSPSAAVADPRTLMTKLAALLHLSLSPLNGGPLGR
jgi:hypothetical protein